MNLCLKCVAHIRNIVYGLGGFFAVGPQLAAVGNEIVVWINDEKRAQLGLECHTAPSFRNDTAPSTLQRPDKRVQLEFND
jgi:hypothetical protein